MSCKTMYIPYVNAVKFATSTRAMDTFVTKEALLFGSMINIKKEGIYRGFDTGGKKLDVDRTDARSWDANDVQHTADMFMSSLSTPWNIALSCLCASSVIKTKTKMPYIGIYARKGRLLSS